MVAVKIGSSFKTHLDFTDDRNQPSWTVPLTRNYVGGKFHCPQTGMDIPILPGQAIAALTRIMPHAGTAVDSGERLTLTLFSPGRLMEWGTKNYYYCIPSLLADSEKSTLAVQYHHGETYLNFLPMFSSCLTLLLPVSGSTGKTHRALIPFSDQREDPNGRVPTPAGPPGPLQTFRSPRL
jgi:hypothetical protein